MPFWEFPQFFVLQNFAMEADVIAMIDAMKAIFILRYSDTFCNPIEFIFQLKIRLYIGSKSLEKFSP